MTEEYLDLVDENDIVIGKVKRSLIYENGLRNYRVINAFIINSENKLWIPRRSPNKDIYPLGLDFSAGGHVVAGSTYEETFANEVEEELNIDVTKVPYKEIGYFKSGEQGLKCFQKVYEIQQDNVPNFNPDDFIEYYWLTPKEIMDRIEKGDSVKSDLPAIIKALYL